MMNVLHKVGLLSCLLIAATIPTSAQSLWLEPDPATPKAGEAVTVHLIQGDFFAGKEQQFIEPKVVAFQRLRKSGRQNLTRADGTIPAAHFDAGEDGVEILALTWKAGSTGFYCKSVQVVGEGVEDHPLRYSEFGQRLEIVPQTDPVALARNGGKLVVQVLFEREPLAGIRVDAMPRNDPIKSMVKDVTDEIGVASLDLDREGDWLIQVSYKTSGTRSRATLYLQAGSP
jgi:hypothetical protein